MQCSVKAGHRVILVLYDMMHDARLYFTGYYELPWRPNVSPGFLCSRLGKLKSRRRNLRWVTSINSDCANFMKINCVQEPPVTENEVATVSATRECTSEEDGVMETNSKAAVRWSFLILSSLWHTSESRNRLITPGRSFRQQRSVHLRRTELWRQIPKLRWEDCFFILPYLWHTSESRNRLITPGMSFPQPQSISWPPGNRL